MASALDDYEIVSPGGRLRTTTPDLVAEFPSYGGILIDSARDAAVEEERRRRYGSFGLAAKVKHDQHNIAEANTMIVRERMENIHQSQLLVMVYSDGSRCSDGFASVPYWQANGIPAQSTQGCLRDEEIPIRSFETLNLKGCYFREPGRYDVGAIWRPPPEAQMPIFNITNFKTPTREDVDRMAAMSIPVCCGNFPLFRPDNLVPKTPDEILSELAAYAGPQAKPKEATFDGLPLLATWTPEPAGKPIDDGGIIVCITVRPPLVLPEPRKCRLPDGRSFELVAEYTFVRHDHISLLFFQRPEVEALAVEVAAKNGVRDSIKDGCPLSLAASIISSKAFWGRLPEEHRKTLRSVTNVLEVRDLNRLKVFRSLEVGELFKVQREFMTAVLRERAAGFSSSQVIVKIDELGNIVNGSNGIGLAAVPGQVTQVWPRKGVIHVTISYAASGTFHQSRLTVTRHVDELNLQGCHFRDPGEFHVGVLASTIPEANVSDFDVTRYLREP